VPWILALIWSVGRAGLAFEGGLFLGPAEIAWLAIELADRRRVTGESGSRDATV